MPKPYSKRKLDKLNSVIREVNLINAEVRVYERVLTIHRNPKDEIPLIFNHFSQWGDEQIRRMIQLRNDIRSINIESCKLDELIIRAENKIIDLSDPDR